MGVNTYAGRHGFHNYSPLPFSLFVPNEKSSPALSATRHIRAAHRAYYCSRRFEYSADREAIKFTHAPEIGVQALAKLHQSRELPAASDALTELFMTHPTFAHRVGAIVKYGQIAADRLPLRSGRGRDDRYCGSHLA